MQEVRRLLEDHRRRRSARDDKLKCEDKANGVEARYHVGDRVYLNSDGSSATVRFVNTCGGVLKVRFDGRMMDEIVLSEQVGALPGETFPAACAGWPAISGSDEDFVKLVRGHWLDSIGNSIMVSRGPDEDSLVAVLTPLIDHPDARDQVLSVRLEGTRTKTWKCGLASLEWTNKEQHRLVWVTGDGRRSVWSRNSRRASAENEPVAFPWLLNNGTPEAWLPGEIPRDILYDGARVAALLDIRQLIGAENETQEMLTHILMDHDLLPMRGDYLIPGAESPLWQKLLVSDETRIDIAQRISRIPHEALKQQVSWNGNSEVWVGHHKVSCRQRDIATLESRWMGQHDDADKSLQIARLLALYSVLDNPMSNKRNGVHLGLDPQLRRRCDYELFASPLNAAVPNGHFASKWPHVEWRFGSVGSYPSVINILPGDAVVCVNPPFTTAYLEDVMERIGDLKNKFRLRCAIPIQEAAWRKKLTIALPGAQLLHQYYDMSADLPQEVLHPTLFWEDPRCPKEDDDEHYKHQARRRETHIARAGYEVPVALAPMIQPETILMSHSPSGEAHFAFAEMPPAGIWTCLGPSDPLVSLPKSPSSSVTTFLPAAAALEQCQRAKPGESSRHPTPDPLNLDANTWAEPCLKKMPTTDDAAAGGRQVPTPRTAEDVAAGARQSPGMRTVDDAAAAGRLTPAMRNGRVVNNSVAVAEMISISSARRPRRIVNAPSTVATKAISAEQASVPPPALLERKADTVSAPSAPPAATIATSKRATADNRPELDTTEWPSLGAISAPSRSRKGAWGAQPKAAQSRP